MHKIGLHFEMTHSCRAAL